MAQLARANGQEAATAMHGIVVTISPVRCAVLALLRREPDVPGHWPARWVGSREYGHIEVLLPSAERYAGEK